MYAVGAMEVADIIIKLLLSKVQNASVVVEVDISVVDYPLIEVSVVTAMVVVKMYQILSGVILALLVEGMEKLKIKHVHIVMDQDIK